MKKGICFRGGWDGHDPVQTVDAIRPRLESAGLNLDVRDSLDGLDDHELLQSFDVIVPVWTMGAMPDEVSKAIDAAVRAGTGMGGWHGGMGDAFRANTVYQFIVGGQFICHPGDIIDYTVEITDGGHPITSGIEKRFEVTSEQYYMHVDPANRVLAETSVVGTGTEWVSGVRMPVVWTRAHGEGRVAYSALGHNMTDFVAEPCMTLAERCILWAAGMLEG